MICTLTLIERILCSSASKYNRCYIFIVIPAGGGIRKRNGLDSLFQEKPWIPHQVRNDGLVPELFINLMFRSSAEG